LTEDITYRIAKHNGMTPIQTLNKYSLQNLSSNTLTPLQKKKKKLAAFKNKLIRFNKLFPIVTPSNRRGNKKL
jgi:hypothetical protein